MTMEKQVVSIFAGTNGYLDDMPIENIRRFEREFLEFMEFKHPEMLQTIAEAKDLNEQTTATLKSIIETFKTCSSLRSQHLLQHRDALNISTEQPCQHSAKSAGASPA